MKIVTDSRIPYIREAMSRLGADTVYLEGASIGPSDVRDADALVVRTRTRCDERLLGASRVRLVLTATIGTDHLDTAFLDAAGIRWANCPGCNAGSVAQYVDCALRCMARDFGLPLPSLTLGVVGCGHVGGRVAGVGRRLGMRVLVCDPPQGRPGFVPLSDIERQADIITFHVPLTLSGPYATYHLAGEDFFSRLERRPFVVNTSRGAVVDNGALLRALDRGAVRQAVIDTWEHEPDISVPLLNKVYIGTPHIAGYSADGKVNADNMVIGQLCRFFGLPRQPLIVPPPLPAGFVCNGDPLQLYNPLADSARLKACPGQFEELRGSYPLRREHCPR